MLISRRVPQPGTPWGRCLAAIALLALTTGCQQGDATAAKQPPAPPPPVVIVAEIQQRSVQVSAEFVAQTQGVPTVEIRARVQGVLEQVRFKEGSEVQRGQVLFVIQQDEYRAALQSARAQLAKAQADLTRANDASVVDRARAQLDQAKADLGKNQADVARYRPLVKEQAIPQQDLDTAVSREQAAGAGVQAAEAGLKDTVLSQRTSIQLAEAAVEAGKAAVIQADLNLRYTTVQSPISGIISKVAIDTGNLVGKGEPTLLATVSSIHPIFVDFAISEADLLRLVKRVPGLGRGEVPPDRAPTLELILADGSVFPHKGRAIFIDRARGSSPKAPRGRGRNGRSRPSSERPGREGPGGPHPQWLHLSRPRRQRRRRAGASAPWPSSSSADRSSRSSSRSSPSCSGPIRSSGSASSNTRSWRHPRSGSRPTTPVPRRWRSSSPWPRRSSRR